MDTIFIRDLSVRGKHGVSDTERGTEQEFLFDVAMDFDTKKATGSDDLKDTVDYGPVRAAVREVAERSSFHLLETLADTVARRVLEDSRIERVSVTVRKTEMYEDCMPGVTIVRGH